MQYQVEVYIPYKPQYSKTVLTEGLQDAALKVLNNIYLSENLEDVQRIISEYDGSPKGPIFWCNAMNGAYVKVTPLNGKTTAQEQAA
jgi:hypothetical protein